MSNILKGIVDENDEDLDENLHKWFKEKWVRFGPDGKIRGPCARGSDSEGKPKCLPQKKAQNLGKKGRKYAANKKRREDPNPERSGKAINVATKKKTNEGEIVKGPWANKSIQQQTDKISGGNVFNLNMPDIEKIAKDFINSKYFHGMLAPDSDSIEEVTDDVVLFLFKKHPEFMQKYSYDQILDRAYQISRMAHKLGGVTPFSEVKESCPHCGGELVDESMMNEKQDACYRKVKSRYKVWPSAYASGALVQCRKKGASNWGTKSESSIMKGIMKEEDEAVAMYVNGSPFMKFNNLKAAHDEYYKLEKQFPDMEITFKKIGKEGTIVLYIDGKPSVKYKNMADAEDAVKVMRSKRPNKKYEIKQETLEDYTGEFAAEKTPAINPYGGLKDKQHRGAISEMPDTSGAVGTQPGGWRKYKVKEEELDEKCWSGYTQLGNKLKSGKLVPNCVKKESAIMKGITRR